jgi:hypothetical protein
MKLIISHFGDTSTVRPKSVFSLSFKKLAHLVNAYFSPSAESNYSVS